MSSAAELAGSTGDSASALRERKKGASSKLESNGLGTQTEDYKSKEDQATWGRTPDGTGIPALWRLSYR